MAAVLLGKLNTLDPGKCQRRVPCTYVLQDKEGKVAYLNKIVAVVGLAINQPVPAKPLKVLHCRASATHSSDPTACVQQAAVNSLLHAYTLRSSRQLPVSTRACTTTTASQHSPTSMSTLCCGRMDPLAACIALHPRTQLTVPHLRSCSDSCFVSLHCVLTDCRWPGAREHKHLPADVGQGSTHGPCSRCCTGVPHVSYTHSQLQHGFLKQPHG